MSRQQLKAVLFDCDGVLLDSNSAKIEAFARTLAPFPEAAVRAFLDYQRTRFGISRYRMFEIFLQRFVSKEVPAGTAERLIAEFGRHSRAAYSDVAETPGCRACLQRLGHEVPLWVTSGSDQAELRETLSQRGLASFFREILGSPTPKSELVAAVRAQLPEGSANTVLVGDSQADLAAAADNDVDFIFMRGFSADADGGEALARRRGYAVIEDLRELPALLGLEPVPNGGQGDV